MVSLMNQFIKINIFSVFYATIFTIQTELMVNVNRLERLAGWVNQSIVAATVIMIFLLATGLSFVFTRKYFRGEKIKYILSVLWLPYFIILIRIFSWLVPFNNPQDDPGNALGLILMALLIAYPFYILIMNFIASSFDSTDNASPSKHRDHPEIH